MRRRVRSPVIDSRIFRRTAARTKSINLGVITMRGGFDSRISLHPQEKTLVSRSPVLVQTPSFHPTPPSSENSALEA